MNGLWTLTYFSTQGSELPNGGVMFVQGDRLWGGDGGFFWTGVVKFEGGGVHGYITSQRYRPGFSSIDGSNREKYKLEFKGGYAPDKFNAALWIEGQEKTGFIVSLERHP